jgi:hypothetical protein
MMVTKHPAEITTNLGSNLTKGEHKAAYPHGNARDYATFVAYPHGMVENYATFVACPLGKVEYYAIFVAYPQWKG